MNQACQQYWKRLARAESQNVKERFAQYVRAAEIETIRGHLTVTDFGMHVAKAMFLPFVERDPDCEAVTQFAGLLEVERSSALIHRYLRSIDVLVRAMESSNDSEARK